MKQIKLIYFITCLIISGLRVSAQDDTALNPTSLNYKQFLYEVKENNLGFLAEKYNLNISQANIAAAKIFPDPELSIGASDNQERTLKMGYSLEAGLDYTLELGGKRKARIHLAKSEAELTNAMLDDFFRHLRADVTIYYLEAMKQEKLLEVSKSVYEGMLRLAEADSIRFRLGEIMKIDAQQSKLEANSLLNEVYQTEADWYNSLVQLSSLQGKHYVPGDVFYHIEGNFDNFRKEIDLQSFIDYACKNRSDLEVARKETEVSSRSLKLVKANRAIDLGLSAGVARNSEVRNEIAPAPAFTSVSAGISIPLKFSNTNKGEISAARFALQQSEAKYKEVELQIQTEVVQAYYKYLAACKSVQQYQGGMLVDAGQILEKKMFSYQNGNTDLLEVLNAQRTFSEMNRNYYEVLYNRATALVELERVTGIWDIEF